MLPPANIGTGLKNRDNKFTNYKELILYRLFKRRASKNNESSSVSRDNRTLREDTDEVLKESDEPEVHVQTDNNCDSNGNNIYRSAYPRYKNKFSDLDAISELRNVLKNGSRPLTEEEMVRLESFSRLDPVSVNLTDLKVMLKLVSERMYAGRFENNNLFKLCLSL